MEPFEGTEEYRRERPSLSDQAERAPMREVPAAYSTIRDEVSRVEHLVQTLEERLAPLRRGGNMVKEKDPRRTDADTPYSTEFARAMGNTQADLFRVRIALETLLEDLEV